MPQGLIYTVYDDYFSDNVNFFNNNTNYKLEGIGSYTGITNNISSINTGTNNYVPAPTQWNDYSVQWLGYFLPDVSGTWTFWSNSDDASYVWIGSNATSGYTVANSLINNGGGHPITEVSNTINMVAGTYYPIRIQYGDGIYDDNMIFSFQGPIGSRASTKITDGDEFYFIQLPNPCFLEGSKILCFKDDSEIYLPIESLKKGDLVKTLLNGYVPIKVIGSSAVNYVPSLELHIKDKLFVCSKENYPELFEDLVLTGAHSILVDDLTDDQKKRTIEILNEVYVTDYKYRLMACIDDKTFEYKYDTDQTIWHLALENENYYGNYGIYANGLIVESFSIRYMLELSNMVLKD